MKVYYFGVWDREHLGHFLYTPGGWMSRHAAQQTLPFGPHILDAGLLPPIGPETEGLVYRSVINGFTVLAFWDRSGDSRFKSNSAFVLEGEHTIREGLALAKEYFPSVFARFGFDLKPASPPR